MSKRADMSQEAEKILAKRGMMSVKDLPPITAIAASGSLAEGVTFVPASNAGLAIATATRIDDHKPVLLPLMEITFGGIPQDAVLGEGDAPDLEKIFSRTLSLENAVWLMSDLTGDIRSACARLKSMIPAGASYDQGRLAHAQFFAEQLRMNAELTASLLDELCAASAPALAAPDELPVRSEEARATVRPGRKLKAPARKRTARNLKGPRKQA